MGIKYGNFLFKSRRLHYFSNSRALCSDNTTLLRFIVFYNDFLNSIKIGVFTNVFKRLQVAHSHIIAFDHHGARWKKSLRTIMYALLTVNVQSSRTEIIANINNKTQTLLKHENTVRNSFHVVFRKRWEIPWPHIRNVRCLKYIQKAFHPCLSNMNIIINVYILLSCRQEHGMRLMGATDTNAIY